MEDEFVVFIVDLNFYYDPKYQLYSLLVSINLLSVSGQLKITIKILFLRLAKQLPAAIVCPVLTPSHPSFSKIFVFNQILISFFPLFSSENKEYL